MHFPRREPQHLTKLGKKLYTRKEREASIWRTSAYNAFDVSRTLCTLIFFYCCAGNFFVSMRGVPGSLNCLSIRSKIHVPPANSPLFRFIPFSYPADEPFFKFLPPQCKRRTKLGFEIADLLH